MDPDISFLSVPVRGFDVHKSVRAFQWFTFNYKSVSRIAEYSKSVTFTYHNHKSFSRFWALHGFKTHCEVEEMTT